MPVQLPALADTTGASQGTTTSVGGETPAPALASTGAVLQPRPLATTDWHALSEAQRGWAADLGYDAYSWDAHDDTATTVMSWAALTPVERAAAEMLGWSDALWHEHLGSDEPVAATTSSTSSALPPVSPTVASAASSTVSAATAATGNELIVGITWCEHPPGEEGANRQLRVDLDLSVICYDAHWTRLDLEGASAGLNSHALPRKAMKKEGSQALPIVDAYPSPGCVHHSAQSRERV